MALIPVNPLVLKDVEATFGADDYRKHLDTVTFTPSAAQKSWTGLGKNTHTDTDTATWTVALAGVQDWDTPDSLSRFLYEHEGETVPFTFRPRSGSGPSFMADVVITPGAIGGAVNAFTPLSVTLGCNGRPVLVEGSTAP